MKVQDLLKSKDKWCQGTLAMTKVGNPVEVDNPEACQWCLIGAIMKCYPRNWDEQNKIYKKIDRLIGYHTATWNDDKNRTFEEVRKLIVQEDI